MGGQYEGLNQGSVGDAAGKVIEEVTGHSVSTKIENLLTGWKVKILDSFKERAFSPDNQDIWDNRAAIQKEFQQQYIGATANGAPMDPLVAERME